MKKINGYMIPKNKGKKTDKCKCAACGKDLDPKEACYYVDGCNYAITNNAPAYCMDCYNNKYKED